MERIVGILARLGAIATGILAVGFILQEASVIVAPIFVAVVIGLMFGPVATRLEAAGIHPILSASTILIMFVTLIAGGITMIASPLSQWFQHLPTIWTNLQEFLRDWRDLFRSLDDLRNGLKAAIGSGGAMTVEIEDGSTVENAAWLAPAILMQIGVFLASLFFFIATRDDIRRLILSLCFERRLRWRVAHIFRDVESMVSRYLLSITAINLGLGLTVTFAIWLLGVPSPWLWGMLAAILNYVPYLGPLVMTAILLGVGLTSESQGFTVIAPAITYLGLNLIEAQFVTPQALGRALMINPFIVFLAIAFWIWIWGPIGGFVAVPVLLIMSAILRHVVPADHRNNAALARSDSLPTAG